MNRVWIGIIILSLVYGISTGRVEAISNAILALPMKGFTLCITLVMSACFWTGIMNIMLESGVIGWVAKALDPLLRLIMPNLNECISDSSSGWINEPSGLCILSDYFYHACLRSRVIIRPLF